jgi:hypothetical protein
MNGTEPTGKTTVSDYEKRLQLKILKGQCLNLVFGFPGNVGKNINDPVVRDELIRSSVALFQELKDADYENW